MSRKWQTLFTCFDDIITFYSAVQHKVIMYCGYFYLKPVHMRVNAQLFGEFILCEQALKYYLCKFKQKTPLKRLYLPKRNSKTFYFDLLFLICFLLLLYLKNCIPKTITPPRINGKIENVEKSIIGLGSSRVVGPMIIA